MNEHSTNRSAWIGPFAFLLLLCTSTHTNADEYKDHVVPFVQKYCLRCHNSEKARGELDLSRYSQTSDVIGDFRKWNSIIEFIRGGEMPPEKAEQPALDARKLVVDTLEQMLLVEAKKHAGDPGLILPRRLSHTEFDRSIRDLTGVDIRPTKTFPADPAAGEGFDNTGEALTMSPSLLKKYLEAAQEVANHLVLKTGGIAFAPFPVTSYNERKKLTEQAILDFYQNHEVQTLDYLKAAWQYRHRGNADRDVSIETWAERQGLSPKYLSRVWNTLEAASSPVGYSEQLGEMWKSIPPPSEKAKTPPELLELNHFLDFVRRQLGHPEERLIRSNAGNWPIGHLDFRAKTAARRDRFAASNLRSRSLIRFERVRQPKKNQTPESSTLSLRIERAFGTSQGNYVVLHRPLFSKSANLPRNPSEEKKHEVVTLREVLQTHSPAIAKRLSFGKHPKGHAIDADSFVLEAPTLLQIPLSLTTIDQLDGKQLLVECELDPEHSKEGSVHVQWATGELPEERFGSNVALLVHPGSQLAEGLREFGERFCDTFPNRFFYVDSKRGLAAGFHLVEGFFRDDKPLVEKVLDEKQVQELDQLWRELDFVTRSSETLIRGFVWFERSERHVLHDKRFDFLRPEDPRLVEVELLNRFERIYLEKMGVRLREGTLEPEKPSDKYTVIHGFFEQIRTGLAQQRKLTQEAEQRALADLEQLAHRAYRRALRPDEAKSLRTLYSVLRKQGQDVESALRGVCIAILMSPDFCYRYTETPRGPDVYTLNDDALASRLSFFLWSSIPDDELLSLAASGKLQDEATLVAQTRRMLKDPKIDAFAREFLGQWLRYRDYLSKDPINAKSFPGYDDDLRQAMFEEPTRLASYLIREDKPITDLLGTDTTFVNGVLAKHYGGAIAKQYRELSTDKNSKEIWHRVDGLRIEGRGGLFGMGVILTKNSAGARTSPVKRGFWTVHHLLGQHFPPPPADVPELPTTEKEAKKTIRVLLAEHAANPSCAMCHTHFDSLGLAMEGFDPIGRARTKDLAGRPIDNVATLPDGESARGIPGLIRYIEKHRQADFVQTLCRKFLGYALGRSVVLSDRPLLMQMEQALRENDYRFSVLFEEVVKSPQFRKQRGREFVDTRR